MKLHFKTFFILLIFSAYAIAQENEQNEKKPAFQSFPELKIYGGIPFAVGDNFLNEAHEPQFGLGLYISPFSVYGVNFGVGLDYSKFKVSDISLAGNVESSNMKIFYAYLSYPVKIADKFDLEPKAGIGASLIRQVKGGEGFGEMDGTAFNLGANIEYELAHPLEIFAGIDYFYSKFDVDANPEYKSFFENAGKLNFFVGLKINFRKRKNDSD